MFSILFFTVLLYKKIVERAVLRDSFRFRKSIWPDFVASTRGAEHLAPKKSLGWGAFFQRKEPHGGEFDHKKKCQMPGGQPGEGGWALLDLTHT